MCEKNQKKKEKPAERIKKIDFFQSWSYNDNDVDEHLTRKKKNSVLSNLLYYSLCIIDRSLFPDYNKSSSLSLGRHRNHISKKSFLFSLSVHSNEELRVRKGGHYPEKKTSLCCSCRNTQRAFFVCVCRLHNDVEDATSNKLVCMWLWWRVCKLDKHVSIGILARSLTYILYRTLKIYIYI